MIFIVIAVGSGRGLVGAASIGAAAACLLVFLVGVVIHKPLSRVPENVLKFGVAIMLSSFGVFWTGEGLGIDWIGEDLMLFVFACVFLRTGLALAQILDVKPKGLAQ